MVSKFFQSLDKSGVAFLWDDEAEAGQRHSPFGAGASSAALGVSPVPHVAGEAGEAGEAGYANIFGVGRKI